ncbi:hypothetical protein RIF29_21489 [Crotalaria pallida]|uniref:Uncharacterized protein n=1 Tax=Crotalaria pallida TaxID=3830 RepID=A0AAN9I9I4_CROPI
MSLSNSASSATSLIQQSATSLQQKTHLPDPFDLKDTQILDRVYLTHVNDDELCDTKILYDLVSNVLLESRAQLIPVTTFKPEFPTLKLISCQMITTRSAANCVHQTTLWILQHLRSYSWDAKALITLAAFSLEYGSFWHLFRVPTTDLVGNSLKQLNQVQSRKVTDDIAELVKFIASVFQHIRQWATWSSTGDYDPEDVPSLTEAFQEIPVVVYWTIASLVASTSSLVGFSLREYNFSDFRERLSVSALRLEENLRKCRQEIGYIDDYLARKKIFDKPKDIVDLLKALIYRNGTGQLNPQIYEGNVLVKTGLEVFTQKQVLLFISSLDSIDDEISLLNFIYNRLQEYPKESIKGFNKEDLKILWIPIVDVDWDENLKSKFFRLKNRIKFYVVEYFTMLPGHKIITDPERLGYIGKPIIPVFDPQGKILNKDALDLIFQWEIDAFPFREIDGYELTQKLKWLWDILKKVIPGLQIKGDRYIFIYGGTNNKWIQDFTMELDQFRRNDDLKRADVIIDHYQLGKDDPNKVPSFWIGIERKKQNKIKHQEVVDCEIQRIANSLFCLKRDPQGWVILSKGCNVKILGHGEAMYLTLNEFQNWKNNLLEKEGLFDIAFKEYYDAKLKEISAREPCSIINVDNYASSVIATITCPNPTCGRVMEVTSVNYKCCHQDAPNTYGI